MVESLTAAQAHGIIQESMNELVTEELLDESPIVTDDTALVGDGSPLDSLAFVSLVLGVEKRVRNIIPARKPPFVITTALLFQEDGASQLTVGKLIAFLVRTANAPS